MTDVVIPIYNGLTPLDFVGSDQLLRAVQEMDIKLTAIDRNDVVAGGLTFRKLLNLLEVQCLTLRMENLIAR